MRLIHHHHHGVFKSTYQPSPATLRSEVGRTELPYTLHRAPVGQGLLPPRPARAFGFWSLRALAKARRGRVYVEFTIIITDRAALRVCFIATRRVPGGAGAGAGAASEGGVPSPPLCNSQRRAGVWRPTTGSVVHERGRHVCDGAAAAERHGGLEREQERCDRYSSC